MKLQEMFEKITSLKARTADYRYTFKYVEWLENLLEQKIIELDFLKIVSNYDKEIYNEIIEEYTNT